MRFIETKLRGAYIVELEPIEDERGFFARSWCRNEFGQHGLNTTLAQCNISFNVKKGTLRGMHYQIKPYEEAKLVSCISGAIYDVIIDLRPDSETYRQWVATNLTAAWYSSITNYRMLYIPEGFAHGFQTLEDTTTVSYQISASYDARSARGIRWDDPDFLIDWPLTPTIISNKDMSYPLFK